MILAERNKNQLIDGHPNRAAPVGIAAKQKGSGFARFVVQTILLAGKMQDQRMSKVMTGDGTHAKGREKFIFIQHIGKQAAQLVLTNEPKEQHFVGAGSDGGLNTGDEIGAVLDEPLAAPLEIGVAIDYVGSDGGSTEHRNKSNHGAGAHGEPFIQTGEEVVVEEAVLFVP